MSFTHDGKRYARVTEVLGQFNDFSGIPKDVLENKCAIGTQVHEAINSDITGDFPFVDEQSVGYFDSFLQWKKIMAPEFVETETRYFDDGLRLTGCIDCLIRIPGEVLPLLVDFKTSAQEGKTWSMQAHLYRYLLKENGKSVAARFLFIKLDKYGAMPKVFEYRASDQIMGECLKAVATFWKSQPTQTVL